MQPESVSLEEVKWLVGGLLGIIAALIGVIWTTFSGEIKRSAIYRHHVAPRKFAEIDSMLIKHEIRIDANSKRIETLEDRR